MLAVPRKATTMVLWPHAISTWTWHEEATESVLCMILPHGQGCQQNTDA